MSKFKLLASAVVLGVAGLAPLSASATPVDLELTLLVGVSDSVDGGEFALQRDGYVNAFNNAAIWGGIAAGGLYHSIAATLVYWSSADEQEQA